MLSNVSTLSFSIKSLSRLFADVEPSPVRTDVEPSPDVNVELMLSHHLCELADEPMMLNCGPIKLRPANAIRATDYRNVIVEARCQKNSSNMDSV